VESLFFNTPARLKFLKAESTERRHITQLVTNYAMAYPQVRLRLVQEGREQFHSTGSGDLADVLVEVFGLDAFRDMLEVSPLPPSRPDLPPVEVYGFTSVPGLNRSNRSQIVLFVNGRLVADPSLTYAVVQAYHTLLPVGRYPLAVLLVTLPPEEVDVNVHPTKAEVRFRAPDAVFAAVQRAVRRAVIDQAPVPPVHGDPYRAGGEGWGGKPATHPSPLQDEQQLHMELDMTESGRYATSAPICCACRNTAALLRFPPGWARRCAAHAADPARDRANRGDVYRGGRPCRVCTWSTSTAHDASCMNSSWRGRRHWNRRAAHPRHGDGRTPRRRRELIDEASQVLARLGFDLELFGTNTFRVQAVPLLADRDPPTCWRASCKTWKKAKSRGAVGLEERNPARVQGGGSQGRADVELRGNAQPDPAARALQIAAHLPHGRRRCCTSARKTLPASSSGHRGAAGEKSEGDPAPGSPSMHLSHSPPIRTRRRLLRAGGAWLRGSQRESRPFPTIPTAAQR
jgi:DNA mismatch repair protein MutL